MKKSNTNKLKSNIKKKYTGRNVSRSQPNFFLAILQRSGGDWTSTPHTAQGSRKQYSKGFKSFGLIPKILKAHNSLSLCVMVMSML